MFLSRFSPLAALAGLLLICSACERHHVGELPELQREHLNPLEAGTEAAPAAAAVAVPHSSPTPANFFPKQQP